jgi:hypothetical protein
LLALFIFALSFRFLVQEQGETALTHARLGFQHEDFSKTCFFRVENSLSLSLSLFRGGPCRSKMHPFINAPLYLWPKEKEGMQRRGMKKEFSVPALGDQRGAGGGGEN